MFAIVHCALKFNRKKNKKKKDDNNDTRKAVHNQDYFSTYTSLIGHLV